MLYITSNAYHENPKSTLWIIFVPSFIFTGYR